jgi:hypothetical protein
MGKERYHGKISQERKISIQMGKYHGERENIMGKGKYCGQGKILQESEIPQERKILREKEIAWNRENTMGKGKIP